MKSNTYYELEHPVYGVWYATSLYKVATMINTSPPYVYQRLKVTNKIKKWIIRPIDNIDDIPFKWINPDNKKIYATQ